MASSIRAIYEDGALKLVEPIDLQEGDEADVIVLARQPKNGDLPIGDDGWKILSRLVDECEIDTGLTDLAHQHDHYLYGGPKKD